MKKLERSQQGQVIAPASIAIKKEAFDNRQETAIYWLGGGGAMINSHGTNLLIDPVLEGFDLPLLIENPLPIEEVGKVDGVLITHIDNDHFSRPTLKDIREQTLSYHAPHYVAEQMQKEGLPGTGHDIYDTFSIGTMKIRLTPACHNWQNGSSKYNFRYWKEEDYCGYWIDTQDGSIWMPGDSKLLHSQLHMPDPDEILFDFADNDWHITLEGAIQLANNYPKADLICIHWGTVDAPEMTPFNGDPEILKERIQTPERLHILAPGEKFVLIKKKDC